MTNRGTPDPAVTELASEHRGFEWRNLPWGVLSVIVVAAILWYQFSRQRKRKTP